MVSIVDGIDLCEKKPASHRARIRAGALAQIRVECETRRASDSSVKVLHDARVDVAP